MTKKRMAYLSELIDLIDSENLETIEVHGKTYTQVIRCKDCIWRVRRELAKTGEEDMRYKPSWCELMEYKTPEDGYCYKAMRRAE